MDLNDYILVKCFENQEYEQQFNSGKLYINGTGYYWNLENTFQQDKEGEVLFIGESNSQDYNLTVDGENIDFKVLSARLDGYISCFYLLPKRVLKIDASHRIDIIDDKEKTDFEYFIKRYFKELQKDKPSIEKAYVSFYDARLLCNLIKKEMEMRNFNVSYRKVIYKNLTQSDKDQLFREKNEYMIIFTKPESYKYQKEFRIFINPKSPKSFEYKDHLEENIMDIDKTILLSFNYLIN